MTPFIRLHPCDDVLIARSQLVGGTTVESISVKGLIPAGHKVATRALAVGDPVRRYNQIIGFASKPIAAGEHVHTQNLWMAEAKGDFARDYAIGADVKPQPERREATFMGYRRADGRVATRNYIGVLSSVNCSATASRAIAGSAELRKALTSDAKLAKATLVSEILKGASGSTVKLVSQLANTWRGRSIESAFADYAHALAARRNRVIALVRVAAPLSAAQQERLSTALNNQVGQPVRINIEIEPTVIGGVSVKFADELVDGTVSNRLAGAARAVVGSK